MLFRSCAIAFILLACVGMLPAPAYAQAVEPDTRAMLILRAVAYERGLRAASGELRLAVVMGPSGGAARDGREMASAFAALARRVRVAGRRLRVTPVRHQNAQDTMRAIRSARADIVYVASGLDTLITEIGGPVGSDHRIMACGDPDGVGKGCMISVERQGRRMRVVVHLRLADAVGKRFDARLLRLSRIVR